VSVLFMVIAFWLGGNVALATAVWSRYRRQCAQEQRKVAVDGDGKGKQIREPGRLSTALGLAHNQLQMKKSA
jgi:hypothetical protein